MEPFEPTNNPFTALLTVVTPLMRTTEALLPPPASIPVERLLDALEFAIVSTVSPELALARNPATPLPDASLSLTTNLLKSAAHTPNDPLFSNRDLSMVTNTLVPEAAPRIPLSPLSLLIVLRINTDPPALGAMSRPRAVKFAIVQFSTCKAAPLKNLIPLVPPPIPLIERLRRVTTSVPPA